MKNENFKKNILIVSVGLLVLLGVGGLVFYTIEYLSKPSTAEPVSSPKIPELTTPKAESSVEDLLVEQNKNIDHCRAHKGTIELRHLKDKTLKGFCIFEDKSECELKEFMSGTCKKGERKCRDFCGDGDCQRKEFCNSLGCTCLESAETCPEDCLV